MIVNIPTPLQSYTNRKPAVEASGATLSEALLDLDKKFPGIRFRMISEQDQMREHIRIFINAEQARDLNQSVQAKDEIHIIAALSGG